jgi:two-component system, NtrC family, nitrogen regulation sensor histidine kinase NtrY
MASKNFRFKLIIRVITLSLTLFLFFYFLEKDKIITPIILFLIAVTEVYSIIRFVDKTNRDLTSFLESIRFSEFTRSFQMEGMGSSFNRLYKAFNDVIDDFQKVRAEKEEHFHYLQTIVQNIDVCIIAYQHNGKVEMINNAAKKLFQQGSIEDIHKLSNLSSELADTLLNIKPGENKLVKVHDENDFLQLAINTTELKIKSKIIILATIKNIQNVLEDQETEAWQKLIRVLTHEIMNSITPISSLSATVDIMLKEIVLKKSEGALIDMESVNEIQQALQTINKRSNGLLHFVNTYRNLTRIPKPTFKITPVSELFNSVSHLLENEFTEKKIKLTINIEPVSLELSIDEQLIEQVLINLIQNSIYALEGIPAAQIELKSFLNKRGRPTIQVIDNGVGILKEVLDKIFIPFFTTKQSGSGIGLSLSRQILKLHGGTITAKSVPDKETVFTLTF